MEAVFSFFGLDEGDGENLASVNLSNCPQPVRYEDWTDAEKDVSQIETIAVSDNRFRVLLHSQKPKWAHGRLGEVAQYDKESGSVHLTSEESTSLQETLQFLKTDHNSINKSPCLWSEIHSLRELLSGLSSVEPETKRAKVTWDSRLGMALRKNKFVFDIYAVPDKYLIDVSIENLTRLVRGICREKCQESVKLDLRMYDFLIAPYI